MTRLTASEVAAKSARNRQAFARRVKPSAFLHNESKLTTSAVNAAILHNHVRSVTSIEETTAKFSAAQAKARFGDTKVAKPAVAHATRTPAQESGHKKGSSGEELLVLHLHLAGLGGFIREFRFHPKRLWRVDFCWPSRLLAVEVEGGTWSSGRHTRGLGFAKDCEKYNELGLAGYRLLRFTPEMVKSGRALADIQRALR